MKINIKKIDEKIARLQELRRIATDPEMTAMLSEFVAADGEVAPELPRRAVADVPSAPLPTPETMDAAKPVDEADAAGQNGRSLWGINRR